MRSPTKTEVRTALREVRHFLVEAALLVGLMIIYWLIRGAIPERTAAAFARADQIIHLERRLGFFWESGWQEQILGNRLLVDVANGVYLYGHLPILILAGIWIYMQNRERYHTYRNALLISACLGLFFYGLFPVAPPRLMPQFGFVDTIAMFDNASNEMQPSFIVNHYAAVPSYHFGWALLIGIALIDISRNLWVRTFAVLFPTLMFFSIVLTANHFIFDAVVGGLLVLLAIVVAFALENFRVGMRQTA
ncbi:MAG TPA: phosphatase PAP2 family protein [Dehalococcoidia bacterium]|nr:phosphatase PAP2 family protein [Dehalococcoidia bacterium]